jgi:hypothetical protein
MNVKFLFYLFSIHSPKLWIHHAHWEATLQLVIRPPSCAFTFLKNFVSGLIKGILGDMSFFSNTINTKLVDKVFIIGKGEAILTSSFL